jgi:hypothetical protein
LKIEVFENQIESALKALKKEMLKGGGSRGGRGVSPGGNRGGPTQKHGVAQSRYVVRRASVNMSGRPRGANQGDCPLAARHDRGRTSVHIGNLGSGGRVNEARDCSED